MKWMIVTLVVLVCVTVSTARRRRSETCRDKINKNADMVFTGTVEKLYRSRAETYRGIVRVKRVVRGDTKLANYTVLVEGFGDQRICHSDVRERDTRIFFVSHVEGHGGSLRLNSSVLRVTITNLDRIVSDIKDLPLKERIGLAESECERMYCAYGALCVVDKRTLQAHCRCQETCSDVFAPVCGSDGVTYSSDCQLRMAACSRQKRIFTKRQGPCDLKDPCLEKECHFGAECQPSLDGVSAECLCPAKCATYGDSRSRPVCGTDGKDYPNVCEMRRTSCLEMREIDVRYKGHCDPCELVKCPPYQVCQLDENRQPTCRCNDVCPPDFRTVCGSDGKTYANECSLRSEACKAQRNVRVIYSGDCSSGTNPCELIKCGPGQECDIDVFGVASCQCPPSCEPRMQPVCGSNGRTFDNECELKRQSCLLRQELAIVHEGECGEHGPCHTHHCSYGAACVVKGGKPVCECPTCSEEFEPVCGTDAISYMNACKLKREACEQKTEITADHQGLCNTCHTQECDFYAVCESFGNGATRCVCPEVCIKVDAPVCGSDGISYANECELRVEACKKQQYIAVATKGTCDQCEHVHCKHGARCEAGRCVCPADCPAAYEFVCGSDGRTYKNECEMKRAGCYKGRELNMQFYGTCEEIAESTGHSDEEDLPALKERKVSSCHERQCRFGGVCDFNSEGSALCVCTFHCPAIKEPVCGSDGRMFDNECRMREEACLVQKRIDIADREFCVDHVDIACDGEPAVVDPATGKDYYCGKGPGSKLCPAKTVCHLTQYFAKCCREAPLIRTCKDAPFGCCPDLRHPVLGPNNGGCPSVCNCNKLGSYSSTCDPVSKQCPCKPGVGGLRCDRCEPGFWGLHKISNGNSGCAHCNCHPYGSVRDDCEQTTGRCVCKHGIQGMKCDTCQFGMVLRPDGCIDESQLNATSASCEATECHHGASCVEREGLPRCVCEFECTPEDSRDPVCGHDGNTYGSECQMRHFACRYQRSVGIRHYGVCTRRGYLENSETTTTPPRLPKRRSYLKKPDIKSTRAVTINLPENLFMTTRAPHGNSTTTMASILGFAPDPEVPVDVPSFNGKSYMEMYKLEAYSRLSLELEFKTFSERGIILYNGQTSSRTGDFVSLSVNDGFVEFRYNLGSGPVVIRSSQKIALGKYHKVTAKRYLKDGMLAVDGQETVSGKSLGTLNSLDLAENLFVGYVPGASKVIFLNTGVENGLIGCIRRLKIDRQEVNLKMPGSKEILKSSGITDCSLNACSSMPCRNGGSCIPAGSKRYECRCKDEFSGENCEGTLNPCDNNPCMDGSTCTTLPGGNFTCKCIEGRSGRLCDKTEREAYVPDFHGSSYLELPTLQNAKHAFSLEIWFLSRSEHGVLLYNGQLPGGRGDFVAVTLANRYVHFTYNLGSGSADIVSRHPVTLNKWHSIKISRHRRQGTLKMDNETTVIGKSKPPLAELNLLQPLYLGGFPDLKHVHKESGVSVGLDGSIQRVVVNGEVWQSVTNRAVRAHAVRKYRGHPCAPGACLHGGTCMPELNSFVCKCPPKFVGRRCERRIRKKGFNQAISFNGTTHLSFRYQNFKGSRSRKSNRFQVRFRTFHPDGLLFWTSKGGSGLHHGDYLAVGLVGGCPELSYNLGRPKSNPWIVRSEQRVDDGMWHSLTIIRKKRLGEIKIDKTYIVSNLSEAGATDLNTDGILWIGGSPKLPQGLQPSYYQGFTGCVQSIVIDKSPLHHLLSGKETIRFCDISKVNAP